MSITRRDFLKYTGGGVAALIVGSNLPWMEDAYGAFPVPQLDFTISDTIKEMVTHNAINTAECYYWTYKEANLPANCPGPTIFATQGDTINIRIKNSLGQPHNLVIPGIFDSGIINPGQTVSRSFTATTTGTFLYFDSLNAPVNRVMGLHGALVVMPPTQTEGTRLRRPSTGKITPYSNPSPQVQQLFNDLGTASHWPGLAWEEGDPDTMTPPFRQYVWLLHQASPTLFREVGSLPVGQIFPAGLFVQRFREDAFSHDNHDLNIASDIPQYFTMNGLSGHFAHNNPVLVPMCRVGEPVVIRVLNAGLMTHSMHIHCNHFYIISVDGVVQGNPNPSNPTLTGPGLIWVDTFTANPWGSPSHRYDLVLPFMRPPDVPNTRGIGRGGSPDPGLPTININGNPTGTTTWPPVEEFNLAFGKTIPVRQSPLCYPAHDHSEPTQTAQGGNYNCGVVGGQFIIGDRNVNLPRVYVNDDPSLHQLPPRTFPMDEDFAMMLGLDHHPQILVYGIDKARKNGIMESSRDSDLDCQVDRPDFPDIIV